LEGQNLRVNSGQIGLEAQPDIKEAKAIINKPSVNNLRLCIIFLPLVLMEGLMTKRVVDMHSTHSDTVYRALLV
jgi:hypothetical protein